jgi:hypothetical protein
MTTHIESLDCNILQEISYFMKGGIKRRLINELRVLKNENAYITVEHVEKISGCILAINVVLNNTTDLFTFYICNSYPFKPPQEVYINYKKYNNSYLKINSHKTLNKIKEILLKNNRTVDCLCCSSICCPSNWSPAVKIQNIIDEFYYYKKIRKNIINELLAIKIINRYLSDDKGFIQYFCSFLI